MSLYSGMPVTPFHLMAGVVAKSIRPKYFSWTVFALANVLIDTEAVYFYFTTGVPQHKYTHSWLLATIIIIICAVLGKYLCEFCFVENMFALIRVRKAHKSYLQSNLFYKYFTLLILNL